jgi:hypothetical protein
LAGKIWNNWANNLLTINNVSERVPVPTELISVWVTIWIAVTRVKLYWEGLSKKIGTDSGISNK